MQNVIRNQIPLSPCIAGSLASTRIMASPLRDQAEGLLLQGNEVVFDFKGIHITQSFADELIGALILHHGPTILDNIIFKACSDDVRAILEFVAADRSDQYVKTHTH